MFLSIGVISDTSKQITLDEEKRALIKSGLNLEAFG